MKPSLECHSQILFIYKISRSMLSRNRQTHRKQQSKIMYKVLAIALVGNVNLQHSNIIE